MNGLYKQRDCSSLLLLVRRIVAIFLVLCFPELVFAQNLYMSSSIQFADGLPSDVVLFTIKKDSFLYISTQRGLCLYDGYIFEESKDINSRISSIFTDGKMIYFDEEGSGLSLIKNIRSKKEIIQQVSYTDSDPDNDHCLNIYKDYLGNIWSTDFHHLKYINTKTKKKKQFNINQENYNLYYDVNYFIKPNNNLIVTTPFGIFIWDAGQDTLFKLNAEEIVSATQVAGKIIVSTSRNELKEYVPSSNTLISIMKANAGLHFIQNTPANTVVCFDEKKIISIDLTTKSNTVIYTSEDKINNVLYDEKTGIFWVSTQHGLIKLWKDKEVIVNLNFQPEDLPVSDIAEDKKGNIWFSGNSGMLTVLSKNGEYRKYKLKESINKLFIHGNSLLVAVHNGVYKMNERDKFPVKIINTTFPVKKAVLANEKIWVVPQEGKIHVYDAENLTENYDFIKNGNFYYNKNIINDITVAGNKIWTASWMPERFGIAYFDINKHEFIEIDQDAVNKDKFVGDYYKKANVLKNGNLLFSAFGGWNTVSEEGKILQTMNTRAYHIASDNIQGGGLDQAGNFWFGSAEGLYQLNPKTYQTVRISQIDGLASNDITGAFCLSADDILYISTDKKVQKINLKKLPETDLLNILKLTAIKVNNQFLENIPDPLVLKEKDALQIDIFFSALNFSNKDKIIYRYKFDDNDWNYIGTTPKLSLLRVASGNHKITIGVGDNLGNIQQKELTLHLSIIPPFYNTRWFYLLITIVVWSVAFGLIRFLSRSKKQKVELKKQISEQETKILRIQMNPHFIFNSLNSINSFIIQKKEEEASIYLTSFSKLLRKILDNSRKEVVTLREEIDTTMLYLNLEKARLEGKFDYKIQIQDVDVENSTIPPLILQPYLENAIWHGIHYKNTNGFIGVNIEYNPENANQIIIKIVDDGVGRVYASKMANNNKTHKSHGIEITEERLKTNDTFNQVDIVDLYNEDHSPKGTMVILKITCHDD